MKAISYQEKLSIYCVTQNTIIRLQRLGRLRTSEAYSTAIRSFMRFRNGKDVLLRNFDSDLMQEYEMYLKANRISPNTISFYMRNLRAVYNRAVEQGKVKQSYPFRHVYTGIAKTAKRALTFEMLKRIKEADLSAIPQAEFARDMFLFSLYTRGMSFVDMAFLRKDNLKNGILTYRRRKTGQTLRIRWEECMQAIVDKYPGNGSPYLLPVISKPGYNERRQYMSGILQVNRYLKRIGEHLGLDSFFTLYSARHSWASIARSRRIPLSIISEGLGHHSETTTQIYLAEIDMAEIDRANSVVLKGL